MVQEAPDPQPAGLHNRVEPLIPRAPSHPRLVRKPCSFSPDGKRLATVSEWRSRTVTIWDSLAGKVVRRIPMSKSPMLEEFSLGEVQFSPDGESLAVSCSDEAIRVWESKEGRLNWELRGHQEGGMLGIAFAANGRSLASCGGDRTLRIWDLNTGAERRRLSTAGLAGVASIAFTPDGASLAVGFKDESVRIWDIGSGKLVQTLSDQFLFQANAFSLDGKSITLLGPGGTLSTWKVSDGSMLRRQPLQSGSPPWLPSPSHPIAAWSRQVAGMPILRVWPTGTGREVRAENPP